MIRIKNVLLTACLLSELCYPAISHAASVILQTPGSRVIAGEVLDQSTGQAIAYVSIGIVGEVPGTVSSENGKFSFSVPANLQSKPVRFSALGYEPRELKAEELVIATAAQKGIRITLAPKSVHLTEVNVKANKWKTRKLGGNTGSVAMVHHNFTLTQLPLRENLGNEMGIKINSDRKSTFIKELNFYLSNNHYEMVKFRVNVYSIKDGLPARNICPRDIYVTVQNREKGWIKIDLEPYNLYVEHDFVIALEWIDCLPRKGSLPLTIPGAIPGFHIIYHKDTSQGNWRKMPPMGMGMNVVVLCEK